MAACDCEHDGRRALSGHEAVRDPEDQLAKLPISTHLEPESAGRFLAERDRIHRHHRQWRSNMPAIDELFEHDDHRAKALAANLATQLEQLCTAWAVESAAAPGRSLRRAGMSERVGALARHWRSVAELFRDQQGWDASTMQTFDAFFEQLRERACQRAIESFDRARQPVRTGHNSRIRVLLEKVARGIFHPGAE